MPDMVSLDHAGPQQRQFNPYSDNGGTILAIAGADFSVIAGDTRQSEGYNIQTRYAPKVFRLYVHASAFSFPSLSHYALPIFASFTGPTRQCWQSMDLLLMETCL